MNAVASLLQMSLKVGVNYNFICYFLPFFTSRTRSYTNCFHWINCLFNKIPKKWIVNCFLTDECHLLQMSGLPLSQTVLACPIQRSPRSRSHQALQSVKDSDRLVIAPGGVESAKAATAKRTVGGAWIALTNPSSVAPIPNGSAVCKLISAWVLCFYVYSRPPQC